MPATTSLLSPLEEAALAFERRTFARPALKDEAIRAEFGMSPARYYLMLAQLVDSPEAMAYDPLLVQRLQRRLRPAG